MTRFALVAFLGAFACLIPATVLAIVGRRDEVTLRQVLFAGSDLGSYPERYVKPRWIGLVKVLNLFGVVSFTIAVFAVLFSGLSR